MEEEIYKELSLILDHNLNHVYYQKYKFTNGKQIGEWLKLIDPNLDHCIYTELMQPIDAIILYIKKFILRYSNEYFVGHKHMENKSSELQQIIDLFEYSMESKWKHKEYTDLGLIYNRFLFERDSFNLMQIFLGIFVFYNRLVSEISNITPFIDTIKYMYPFPEFRHILQPKVNIIIRLARSLNSVYLR